MWVLLTKFLLSRADIIFRNVFENISRISEDFEETARVAKWENQMGGQALCRFITIYISASP